MKAVSPAKDLELAPSQTWLVSIDVIDVAPQVRTRFDKEGLAELAESIKANGILQPLLLRPGKKAGRYELIAGERRLRAAKAAGLTHVPAITGQTDDQAKLRMQIAENLDREDLELEEIAKVVRALYDAEGSIDKVAAIVKRSKPWVSKHLAVTLRWAWRARRLLEEGRCEDIELLGAFSQYCELAGRNGSGVRYEDAERVEKLIRAGKMEREAMRRMVREAKLNAHARQQAEEARAKKPAAAAKPKPKRFNPKSVVRDLFHAASIWHMWDRGSEIKPDENAATYVEEKQRAAILDVLRKAYDEGVAAAAEHGPYAAVLGKFYIRSYGEGHEHAAWIAGAFGRPLELEALLRDVMAARARGEERKAGQAEEELEEAEA